MRFVDLCYSNRFVKYDEGTLAEAHRSGKVKLGIISNV